MEIEVGEYCRTKEGYIGKYLKDGLVHKTVVLQDNELIWTTLEKDIAKHSPNIIDLIEVGDIIVEMKAKILRIIRINNIEMLDRFRNGDKIYSIVTFEQFSSLEYII